MPLRQLIAVIALSGIAAAQTIALDKTDRVELKDGVADIVTYRGRSALKLTQVAKSNADALAMIKGQTFRNGTLEAWVAGNVSSSAGAAARGFIGLAFRVQPQASKYEVFYLRPTNGRADDQVRRNHSLQYASHPDYPWQRLRTEAPEKYESYVDLEPGVWTQVKIVVAGTQAKLYVHGAAQPSLIVTDLKLGDSDGGIALWIGPGTEGYFSDLKISH